MKITLDIDDRLLAEARALAVRQRTSLSRVIEGGLRQRLSAPSAARPRGGLFLPLLEGRGGLVAGVDPLSNEALLAAASDDD